MPGRVIATGAPVPVAADAPCAAFWRQAADTAWIGHDGKDVFVAGFSHDALTGEERALVPWITPGLLRDPVRLTRTLHSVARRFGVERVVVRVPGDAAVADVGVVDTVVYVARPARVPPPPPGPTPVRPADDQAATAFVVESLVTAHVDGYEGTGGRVDHEAVRNHVVDMLADPSVRSLVAWDGGQPIAHVTWRPFVDEVTGRSYREVVDTLVASDYGGRGLTEELLAALERDLGGSQLPLLGSVVCDRSAPAALAHLSRSGWTVDHRFASWVAT